MPSDWASRPAFTRWKSGVGDEQVLGRPLPRSPRGPSRGPRRPNGRRCCCFMRARLALGVVQRPLVERDDALPRLLDQLLAELDGLGQDDLFLGGQQGDLADLLEVHPDRVVDADHVRGDRLEVLGGRLVDRLRIELRRAHPRAAPRPGPRPSSATTSMPTSAPSASAAAASGLSVEIVIVVVIVVVVGDGHRPCGHGRGRRPAILASSSRPWRGAVGTGRLRRVACRGDRRAWYLRDGSGRWPRRPSSRVSSRRRSSDRRASLIWRRSCHQPVDRVAIAGSLGLALGGFVVVAAFAQLVVLELEEQSGRSRSGGRRRRACAGSGPGLAYNARASAAVSSSTARSSAAPSNGGWTPWSSGSRWSTIARNSSRATVLGSWSGPELVGHPELLVRDEQQEAEQLALDRRHGAQDVVDRQRVGRRRARHRRVIRLWASAAAPPLP